MLFIIAAIILVKATNVEKLLDKDFIASIINPLGFFGVLLFMVIYMIGTVIFLPGTPLSIIAGFLFGSIQGTIAVVIGATLGACIAFGISRYLGKDFTERFLKGRFKKLYAYDKKLEDNGLITILFLRIVPLFPFNGLNFALGLTKIKFKDFILGTVLGIIPGSFILVNIGSNATSISSPKLYLFIFLFILLALIPTCYKGYTHYKKKRDGRENTE